ncbi:MAG: hypothetical protein AB7N65_12600 [Vicinamibacterales bacterium]
MTIIGVRRRLGRLERSDGPGTGLAAALEEGWRRARAGLPPPAPPTAEELDAMLPSLRGAWQRLLEGRHRVADHVATTG